MIRAFFILSILLLGQFFFIISKENINLSDEIQSEKFVELYLNWFGTVYENVFEISGNVVKTDWFAYNNTNSDYS